VGLNIFRNPTGRHRPDSGLLRHRKKKYSVLGSVIPQAVSRSLPTASALVRAQSDHVGFVVDKLSASISISPANHHSTIFIVLIITRGPYNRPTGGRRAQWTQLDSTAVPNSNKKKFSVRIEATSCGR
jgi:hypothetical protein